MDYGPSPDFRVVQLTPRFACSVHIGLGLIDAEPGWVQGLYLVVPILKVCRPSWRTAASMSGRSGTRRLSTHGRAASRPARSRAFDEDEGIDYLLHHPDWDYAEHLAQDEGHFMGPGLSWAELAAATGNGLPGDSTTDPHARLLLLLPAFGDDAVPDDAVNRLTAALRARTRVEAPDRLAAALLEDQRPCGPVRWTTDEGGSGSKRDGTRRSAPAQHGTGFLG
ncbi:hypothetical protein ACFOZ0_17670 [Streptomyces yaanensis]|uniref:Uncharacterized protein n=1 Tax=Streptomyces yaanensis TaxID=1142239 RepID=A0ABV7SGU6_9ACTN|nr:hypothetical protein [Streptomyces sp. CGMCC 4.7035]WNB99257.1 hypothetical protein Q2K21_14880 [Streptomyces sp. CGMCC 4.7035]